MFGGREVFRPKIDARHLTIASLNRKREEADIVYCRKREEAGKAKGGGDGSNQHRKATSSKSKPVADAAPTLAEIMPDVPLSTAKRRDLDESQRAMDDARLTNLGEGRPAKTASLEAVSQKDAAQLLNVSRAGAQSPGPNFSRP